MHIQQSELQVAKLRIASLEEEIALLRRKERIMRHALTQAQATILGFQAAGRPARQAYKIRLSKWSAQITKKIFRAIKKESTVYLSQSQLEQALLQRARLTAPAIEGVVVDFHQIVGDENGANWRVVGIANGKLDAEQARLVVQEAVRHFTKCIVVADAIDFETKSSRQASSNRKASILPTR